MRYFLMFIAAFIISLCCTPLAIKLAPKIGAMDVPKDARRMHTHAMPRFGGMAIYLGTIIALAVFLRKDPGVWGVILSGSLIYLVGIYDDLRGMPAKVKFLAQIGCALVLFFFNVRISFVRNPFAQGEFIYFPWIIALIITVIWVVGITNTVNLIDGLDGLAAGVAFIASICISYSAEISGQTEIAIAMLAVSGGALGFLPFNFHPAKIFMGDGGSLFLGFMLASISVLGSTKGATLIATIVPFFVLGLPIFDTAFAIVRRWLGGRPIMEADKGHLHHRIMAVGLGQRRTVLIMYGISAIMGVVAILIVQRLWFESALLLIVAAVLILVFLEDHSVLRRSTPALVISQNDDTKVTSEEPEIIHEIPVISPEEK